MSGTSIDAVDGVAVRFDASGNLEETLAAASLPIPTDLRRRLAELQAPGPDELAQASVAANRLADLYADCVRSLLDRACVPASAVIALAAHGQTVRHDPKRGYTIQLMNGARLAEATGIHTVTDLRSADVAAGGQGAPLVPAFHSRVFRGHLRRAIVNIGGIANITILEPGDASAAVTGYDTGPGNTLLDAWCELHTGERFDRDGEWAAAGQTVTPLLDSMLEDPYFRLPAPKSTGRDLFNIGWLQRQDLSGVAPVDVQTSLLELTVRTIADGCRLGQAAEIFVCGGGAANPLLMSRLQAILGDVPVRSTASIGMDPQAVEATAFAWLALQRLKEQAGNLPAVTGASGPRVLGALHVSGSGER
jgi:anhydro-N-acetylmuramic acid kinase